jgi:hypothetical protein
LERSTKFFNWILGKTKFADCSARIVLLRADNPWYQSKANGKQSETDILLVCEDKKSTKRFALHFENKLADGHFMPEQPEQYELRAREWMNMPKFANYSDFETILVAPHAFYKRNDDKVHHFNKFIPHEDIAIFIPEFAQS